MLGNPKVNAHVNPRLDSEQSKVGRTKQREFSELLKGETQFLRSPNILSVLVASAVEIIEKVHTTLQRPPRGSVTFFQELCEIQGSSYLLGQRFSACIVLKFPLHREGENSVGMQISK